MKIKWAALRTNIVAQMHDDWRGENILDIGARQPHRLNRDGVVLPVGATTC